MKERYYQENDVIDEPKVILQSLPHRLKRQHFVSSQVHRDHVHRQAHGQSETCQSLHQPPEGVGCWCTFNDVGGLFALWLRIYISWARVGHAAVPHQLRAFPGRG